MKPTNLRYTVAPSCDIATAVPRDGLQECGVLMMCLNEYPADGSMANAEDPTAKGIMAQIESMEDFMEAQWSYGAMHLSAHDSWAETVVYRGTAA